ncbi:MAG: hypothetical protein ACXWTR_05390, partial [Methylotenera sp.]
MWAMTAAGLDIIKQNGSQQMYENAWSMILDAEGPSRLSTVDATVRQFSDYLRCIQSFCHSKGVSLRTDSRLLRLAFDNY